MHVNALRLQSDRVTSAPVTVSGPVVFVIDDDVSVRKSLEALIKARGWQPETFSSGQEFLSRPHAKVPSCLVVDVALSGFRGLNVQACLVGRADLPIIFMANPIENELLLPAISDAIEQSRATIRHDADIEVLLRRYALLTRREREVMRLVVSGLLNKQVGGELGISEITVKAHRGQVMRKMLAGSLPELVMMAAELDEGVIDRSSRLEMNRLRICRCPPAAATSCER
jgi:FixJ family two-component response regulator